MSVSPKSVVAEKLVRVNNIQEDHDVVATVVDANSPIGQFVGSDFIYFQPESSGGGGGQEQQAPGL